MELPTDLKVAKRYRREDYSGPENKTEHWDNHPMTAQENPKKEHGQQNQSILACESETTERDTHQDTTRSCHVPVHNCHEQNQQAQKENVQHRLLEQAVEEDRWRIQ